MNDPENDHEKKMKIIREKFNKHHRAKKKLTEAERSEFAAWIQTLYEKGEKLSQSEMYEVRRQRTVYAILIDDIVRNIGHTYLPLNPSRIRENTRSGAHIGQFNWWWNSERAQPADRKDTAPKKHGYYDVLVDHLTAKGLRKWTRKNSPEIVFKELEKENRTGHESGEREEHFRQAHIATTKNVNPGGWTGGKGIKRAIRGDRWFGSVTYQKHRKRFTAEWSDEDGVRHFLKGSKSRNIEHTYNCLLAKWKEIKYNDYYKGRLPPKSLELYKTHFFELYGIIF